MDFAGFEAQLLETTRRAFQAVQDEHPDETFYAFALYTTDACDYVVATCNTEEGLERRAQFYRRRDEERGNASNLQSLRTMLRWNPCDWEYHLCSEADFDPLNQAIQEHFMSLQGSLEEAHSFCEAVLDCCGRALSALDREALFAPSRPRSAVTVNLLMGDQSDEDRLAWAARLNPPAVVELLRHEQDRARQAFMTW